MWFFKNTKVLQIRFLPVQEVFKTIGVKTFFFIRSLYRYTFFYVLYRSLLVTIKRRRRGHPNTLIEKIYFLFEEYFTIRLGFLNQRSRLGKFGLYITLFIYTATIFFQHRWSKSSQILRIIKKYRHAKFGQISEKSTIVRGKTPQTLIYRKIKID